MPLRGVTRGDLQRWLATLDPPLALPASAISRQYSGRKLLAQDWYIQFGEEAMASHGAQLCASKTRGKVKHGGALTLAAGSISYYTPRLEWCSAAAAEEATQLPCEMPCDGALPLSQLVVLGGLYWADAAHRVRDRLPALRARLREFAVMPRGLGKVVVRGSDEQGELGTYIVALESAEEARRMVRSLDQQTWEVESDMWPEPKQSNVWCHVLEL